MTAPATMREVFLLIGEGDVILWSDASASPLALPDSRERWDAIWSNRDRITDVVHSHPLGPRAFSDEDLSTMAALDAALGRPLRYCVLAPDGLVVREGQKESLSNAQPWWAALLRLASGMA